MVELTLFQNIINGSIPCHKVAEGTHWFAFLDIAPRRAGHTLVVPKKGVQRLSDLDETEAAALIQGVQDVQRRLSHQFNTTDFTVCLHDGPRAGQEVPHVHFHVLPRTEGDGGGTLHSMWKGHTKDVDQETLQKLSLALRGENHE